MIDDDGSWFYDGSRKTNGNAPERGKTMHITVLSDNNGTEALAGEWGLSILIEEKGLRFLLDAGSSDLCIKNARLLGLDLGSVDAAVLSHAHYDHADGFVPLLRAYPGLRVYVRGCAGANCYAVKEAGMEYIGVDPALTAELEDRLIRVEGDYPLAEGVWLIPHKCPDRERIGRREKMFLRRGDALVPDDFSHEQSLVFETEKGLVVFNSCSHAGAAEIVGEVCRTFPGQRVYAYIGGFHLYRKTPEEVREFARGLEAAGVKKLCTGHCTGEAAFAILKERLGESITQFRTGLEMDI